MEINSVNSKYEDEQSLNSTLQRKLKEHQVCPGLRRQSSPFKMPFRAPWLPSAAWPPRFPEEQGCPRVLDTDPSSPHTGLESKPPQ